MDKYLFDRIWEAQEKLAADPQYTSLLEEYKARDEVLLAQLDTMTMPQRDAVMDYLGVLMELGLKMLICSLGDDTG